MPPRGTKSKKARPLAQTCPLPATEVQKPQEEPNDPDQSKDLDFLMLVSLIGTSTVLPKRLPSDFHPGRDSYFPFTAQRRPKSQDLILPQNTRFAALAVKS